LVYTYVFYLYHNGLMMVRLGAG